jgi:hypothetical protein
VKPRLKTMQNFPNHKSKLAEIAPELIEIFDNFVLDEVLRYG